MIGNAFIFDKFNSYNIKNVDLDEPLKKYLRLINGNNVLDLGIGQGKCSIDLSNHGYNVTGVDLSNDSFEACKNTSINFVKDDIRKYKIEENKYNLIISRCVLHFLHKDDVFKIVKNIKEGLVFGSLVYISIFSISDPSLKRKESNQDCERLINNIIYNKSENTYMSYYTKREILDLFTDLKTIMISDELSLDLSHGKPHYHGMIKYVGLKG